MHKRQIDLNYMRKSSDEHCAQSTAAAEEDTPILRNLPPWCFAGAAFHNGQKSSKTILKQLNSIVLSVRKVVIEGMACQLPSS